MCNEQHSSGATQLGEARGNFQTSAGEQQEIKLCKERYKRNPTWTIWPGERSSMLMAFIGLEKALECPCFTERKSKYNSDTTVFTPKISDKMRVSHPEHWDYRMQHCRICTSRDKPKNSRTG